MLGRTVAITPSKSKNYAFEEVKRVCHDSTIKGIEAMIESRSKNNAEQTPFRFMYVSGIKAERDQTKTPEFLPEYLLLRVSSTSLHYATNVVGWNGFRSLDFRVP